MTRDGASIIIGHLLTDASTVARVQATVEAQGWDVPYTIDWIYHERGMDLRINCHTVAMVDATIPFDLAIFWPPLPIPVN